MKYQVLRKHLKRDDVPRYLVPLFMGICSHTNGDNFCHPQNRILMTYSKRSLRQTQKQLHKLYALGAVVDTGDTTPVIYNDQTYHCRVLFVPLPPDK